MSREVSDKGPRPDRGTCEGEESLTGVFCEALVEGLRSWDGEGARLMEAVWMVSAISRGRLEDAIVAVVRSRVGGGRC